MRQYQIRITECAEEDLEKIGDYIAYQLGNLSAAENTVRGIRDRINSLLDFPERNELDEDAVYIIRILHMLVDSKAWLYRTFGL